MTREEAKKFLENVRKMYQPIHGFPDATDRKVEPFYNRIKSIADYCGHNDKYIIAGCANGYSCFELAKLGARVKGVDMRNNWLEVARATAVYNGISTDNPQFIHATFPRWFEEVSIKPDWTVMMMVLHNMLGRDPPEIVYSMLDRVAEISKKGFIMTTRGRNWPVKHGQIPDYLIEHTRFNNWEEIPCPLNDKGKRAIVFGFPIWVFTV